MVTGLPDGQAVLCGTSLLGAAVLVLISSFLSRQAPFPSSSAPRSPESFMRVIYPSHPSHLSESHVGERVQPARRPAARQTDGLATGGPKRVKFERLAAHRRRAAP